MHAEKGRTVASRARHDMQTDLAQCDGSAEQDADDHEGVVSRFRSPDDVEHETAQHSIGSNPLQQVQRTG